MGSDQLPLSAPFSCSVPELVRLVRRYNVAHTCLVTSTMSDAKYERHVFSCSEGQAAQGMYAMQARERVRGILFGLIQCSGGAAHGATAARRVNQAGCH